MPETLNRAPSSPRLHLLRARSSVISRREVKDAYNLKIHLGSTTTQTRETR